MTIKPSGTRFGVIGALLLGFDQGWLTEAELADSLDRYVSLVCGY